jgi:hypothetical protein
VPFDVELLGSRELREALRRAEPRIQDAVAHEALKRVRLMEATARDRASGIGRMQAHAGRTVESSALPDGGQLRGGGGSSLGDIVFAGSEYGGRRKRSTYVIRGKGGRPTVVRRRTTMQFRPWLGQHGYFFWPAVRTHLRGLSDTAAKLIEENVLRG